MKGFILAGQVADAMAEMAGVRGETPAQRAERLAVLDAARVAAARRAIGEEYYSQFTFRPAINERSRRLARVWCRAACQLASLPPPVTWVHDLMRQLCPYNAHEGDEITLRWRKICRALALNTTGCSTTSDP